MPTIFVHGVNTRRDPSYDAQQQLTARFLARHLHGAPLGGTAINAETARFPYWGDLATPDWAMKSLPAGEIDALGGGIDNRLRPLLAAIHDALPDATTAGHEPLLTLARHDFESAVDTLVDLALLEGDPPDVVADFAMAAQTYAVPFRVPNQPPTWLAACTSDENFLAQFLFHAQAAAVDAPQALGVFSAIGNALATGVGKLKHAVAGAGAAVLDRAGDYASTKVLGWARNPLNENLGRFFGDVFYYMDGRGDQAHPGAIPQRVLGEWDAALTAAPAGEPLVIVGHSLGGVITYDLLSHFRPDLQVDLLVTVGSQVSHFEEIKLFKQSQPGAGGLIPRPANIKRWLNVYDAVDIFAYACARVFQGVTDYHYDTHTYVVKAHGAYFKQARFYERLRARIDGLP
ncbi:MAG: hypothetical protein R3D98_15285 [Candidatus Krumholzibacteriia bacterium]